MARIMRCFASFCSISFWWHEPQYNVKFPSILINILNALWGTFTQIYSHCHYLGTFNITLKYQPVLQLDSIFSCLPLSKLITSVPKITCVEKSRLRYFQKQKFRATKNLNGEKSEKQRVQRQNTHFEMPGYIHYRFIWINKRVRIQVSKEWSAYIIQISSMRNSYFTSAIRV